MKRSAYKTKSINKNAVSVVVADGTNAATATPGKSTEILQQQQYRQKTKINKNKTKNNNFNHQSHRTCPTHVYVHAKEMFLTESGVLSGCSDASTNSSGELLDMDVDDKIAPIFEEDLNEVLAVDDDETDEVDVDGEDDDDDDEELDEEEEEEEYIDEEEDDIDDDEECIEIDVEHDDMEFCGTSRKSTYSVKSSVSRYDKLLTLAAPKQPAVMPTSLSFNDNSNATNTKLQQIRQKQQPKEQQKVQRWREKFKTDKKQIQSNKSEEYDKTHAVATTATAGSQKNIVKRALLSLASGGGSGSGTRPKSTSSLKFGNNKLHLLTVGYKSSNKNKQQKSSHINQETTKDTTAVVEDTATTSKQTTTTTKSNLGNIITSLLRTTTL